MNRREWMITAMSAAVASCGRAKEVAKIPGEPLDLVLNPERGFYSQHAVEDAGDFEGIRATGSTIILLTVNLKDFRNRQLNDAKLDEIDSALKAVRKAGLKVIFRAAYGFTDADYRVDPEDLGLIRRHIRKISEVLSKHAPVVWAVQAGMLGPWGEWHGSNHGDPPSLEARQAVVDSWLKDLPQEIFLQVRRPMFLREMFPSKNDKALLRTGWHNDAMLANPDDMGTYSGGDDWGRDKELEWCEIQARRTPFGGETVPASEATGAQQVIYELKLLRLTYLNRGYHGGTLDRWKQLELDQHSLYRQVEAKMGHRWTFRELRMAQNNKAVRLKLENTGFAPLYTPRKVELAWLDPKTMAPMKPLVATTADLKGLTVESGVLEITAALPPSLVGSVLGIRIPDHTEALREDGRYAIHLVGARQFDSRSGWNVVA